MTKRIFAIVLALVLSVSVFAIPTFAAGEISVQQTGNDLVASWAPVAGATSYTVKVYKGSTLASTTTVATPSAKYTVNAAGNYQFAVEAMGTNGLVSYTSNVIAATYTNTTTNGGLTFTRTGTTVTISWTANANAASYNVTYSVAGVNKGTWNTTATTYTINDVPATSAVTASVTYNTTAGQQNAGQIGSGSTNGVNTGTGSATGTVNVYNGYVTWSYAAGTATTQYVIDCYNSSGKLFSRKVATGTTSVAVSALPAGTVRVEIRAGGAYGSLLGSAYVTGYSNPSVSNGSVTVVSRTSTEATIAWTDLGANVYLVKYVSSLGTSDTIASYTESATIPCHSGETVQITITAYDGVYQGKSLTATLTGSGISGSGSNIGGSGSYYGALNINKGATASQVSWSPVTGATFYQVSYKKSGDSIATSLGIQTTTAATVPCGSNEIWNVTVVAFVNGQWMTIGTTTVTPGTTTGSTTGATTTSGSNCTVVSTATSSTIQWNGTSGLLYTIVYAPEGTSGASTTSYSTTATIPVGHSTDFMVYVLYNNQIVAYANVKKSTGTTGSMNAAGTTTIKNLNLDSTAWQTEVSWEKYDNTQYYQIEYSYVGATASEKTVTTATKVTIPFGKNSDFVVNVYAVLKTGALKTVGTATYYAKSATTTPDVEVEDVATEEFTGVWAENLGDGVVKIYWNEVKDEDTYKVYYRKVGASKWSGGHKRTKTYISIDFGSKDADYEFKIEAGDEVSNVFVLNPSDDKGTCAFAHDGEADLDINLYGEVRDAENCKIKLTWDEVKGADGYKVYYREAGKSDWKGGWSRSSESITVTFKKESANKVYEIKIVADGDDSDIFTLKPAVWANAD